MDNFLALRLEVRENAEKGMECGREKEPTRETGLL